MDWNWRGLHMRDIKRAERLLSLFTSPDSAAGIVGDLSEEQGQRGSMWIWRQILGTVLSLCRGAFFESPVVVMLLVVAGFVLLQAISLGVPLAELYLLNVLQPTYGLEIFIFLASPLLGWPGKLLIGMALVAVAQRRGMVACAMLAALIVMLSVAFVVLVANTAPFLWLIKNLGTSVLLLLGGAMIRRRQIRKLLGAA
jgi:hypothetical protein